MKRVILIAFLALTTQVLHAQEKIGQAGEHIVYKQVPAKLNIRDKIIISNKSPYYILQIVVAVKEGEQLVPLGSSTFIAPNEDWELASYRDNTLKSLRGKTIAIKTKAAKVSMGERNETRIDIPFSVYSFGIRHKELDPEIVNNLKPEDITYDFDAKLYESRHDLYIEVFNSKGNDIMDF